MAEKTHILSHWTQHMEGLNQSTQQFYTMVQSAVEKKKIPDVKFARVDFKEGGMFSSSREYLRIVRGDLRYDICGAPFGNGFFVSSRLFAEGKFADGLMDSMDRGGALSQIASGITSKVIGSDTYMKIDSAHMYQTLVHRGVLESIDEMTSAANLPPLPEAERKPVLKGFFQ
jgi:hypothetical protein